MIDDDETYPDWAEIDEELRRTPIEPPLGPFLVSMDNSDAEVDSADNGDLIVECWTEYSWYFYIYGDWHKYAVPQRVMHPDEIDFLNVIGEIFDRCVNLVQSVYRCADGSKKYGTPMYMTTDKVTDWEYKCLFEKYGDLEYRDRSSCDENSIEFWDKVMRPQFEAELHSTSWEELFKPLPETVEEMPIYDGT